MSKTKNKVKVSSIQIQYPDGEVKQVSIDDAQELYKQLEKLFGEKTQYIPSKPIYIARDRWPYWREQFFTAGEGDTGNPSTPKIWCCAD